MNPEDYSEFVKEFTEAFSGISRFRKSFTLDIRNRKLPGNEISAEILDSYLVECGYIGIGTAWIELSVESAKQCLNAALQEMQLASYRVPSNPELPKKLVAKFLSHFGFDARFFTHGLHTVVDEYPILTDEPNVRQTEVRRPFVSVDKQPYLYSSFALPVSDPLQLPSGLVAIDGSKLGLLFLPPLSC